jgi:hypothetical protein
MSDLAEQGSKFFHDLGDAASRSPISAALIGMGVLWLFGGRMLKGRNDESGFDRFSDTGRDGTDTGSSRMRTGMSSASGALSSATETVQSSASSVLDSATRFGRQQADSFTDYAKSIPDTGSQVMQSARSNLAELFRAQPLALGAIGLAIGAGIAASLPITRLEEEYLGETSEKVKEATQEFASERASRVGEVAEKVFNATAEEARRQGLSVDGAKEAAGDIKSKVERVAEAARKGATERAS